MIGDSSSVYKKINITDEGRLILTNYVFVTDYKVTSHFVDARNNREILVEQLGNCQGDHDKLTRIFDNYKTELTATITTIENSKNPWDRVVDDGSFVEARRKFVYRRFDCEDENDKLLLMIEVGVDRKKVFVTYIKTDGHRFIEQIADLEEDSRGLNVIFDEFQGEFIGLFGEINRSGKSVHTSVADNSFMDVRRKMQAFKTVKEFTDTLRHYLDMHCKVHKQRIESGEIDASLFENLRTDSPAGTTIIDWDVSFSETLLGVFFRSTYCRERVPPITELIGGFMQLRKLRAKAIEMIKTLPEIVDYQLYHNKIPVAMKADGVFYVLDEGLFANAMQVPTTSEMERLLATIITEEFVDHGVAAGIIPASRRKYFNKWMGRPLIMAVVDTNVYGNVKKIREFQSKEVMSWKLPHRDLFSRIVTHLQKNGMTVNSAKNPSGLDQDPLDAPIALKIYQYMQGQLSFEQLDVTSANALEILTVVKLFDYAVNLLNWGSLDKLSYERCSYELKARILEAAPSAESHQVFTRTLQTKTLDYCLQHIDPTRSGLHAKEVGTMFLRARQLSHHLDRILAPRGNTASGKSTLAPYGALNVDDLKAAFKKGFRILNTQVHPEAAEIFRLFLNRIANTTKMNYCLDSRLIEPAHLLSNVLLPAQQRQVPAEIDDYEVPLATSLLRILTRPTYEKDACPSFKSIVDGYTGLRSQRAAVIALIENHETVTSYELHLKQGPTSTLVAHKKEGIFQILDRALYNECLREPSANEIDEIVNLVITPELILQAVEEHDIYPHQALALLPFIGKTLKESVEAHVNGLALLPGDAD